MGKTSLPKEDTQHLGKGADTQEPTSIMEVEPQEPVLHLNGTRIKEHSESDIIKDTMIMLKDLAQTVIAMTSQVKIPLTLRVPATSYAIWIFNALP